MTDRRDVVGGGQSGAAAAQLAEQAAEAIRALNHATIAGRGYAWPSDVSQVVADLGRAAYGMAQALDQASRALVRLDDAGQLRHDQGENPSEAVDLIRTYLGNSGRYAGWLAEELSHAHQEASHLGGVS